MKGKNYSLEQHQPAKERNNGCEAPGENSKRKEEEANHRECAGCHTQPVIQHRVVWNRVGTQALKQFLSVRPRDEHAYE